MKVKMLPKKISVTVGISAFNEEANISCLLDSLVRQRRVGYTLERVCIISDGSTDNTEKIVLEYALKFPFIELVRDGKRSGQISRINQIYRMNTSDIVVNLDGDATLADEWTLEKLVMAFKNEKVGLVGGCDTPLPPRTFFEKIVVTHIALWHKVRVGLNGGDSVYNLHGCVSALRKELARKMSIPPKVFAQDTYLYFRARELGYGFYYQQDAVVYYRAPANFRDYYLQVTRFTATRVKISDHFGPWIEPLRHVPFSRKVSAAIAFFFRHPILLPLALGLRGMVKVRGLFGRPFKQFGGTFWDPISSTKTAHKNQ